MNTHLNESVTYGTIFYPERKIYSIDTYRLCLVSVLHQSVDVLKVLVDPSGGNCSQITSVLFFEDLLAHLETYV